MEELTEEKRAQLVTALEGAAGEARRLNARLAAIELELMVPMYTTTKARPAAVATGEGAEQPC